MRARCAWPAGCANVSLIGDRAGASAASGYRRSQPAPTDYPILLQEGQGRLEGLFPAELYERACKQGWADGCTRLAGVHFAASGGDRDMPKAVAALERACDELGSTTACSDLGTILRQGDGVPSDPVKGRAYLDKACDGGYRDACARAGALMPANGGGSVATTPTSPRPGSPARWSCP